MSKRFVFGTMINDPERLHKACDRMRGDTEHPVAVIGPRFVANYPGRNYTKMQAYVVRLPGWYGECAFACDGTGDMVGDNESPYYDERPIDQATGEPIDVDPETGRAYRVHPDVKSGKKRAGSEGTGDIRHLNRLVSEYAAIALEEEALNQGGTIAYRVVNEETGGLEVAYDLPEAV